jgi:CO/xanthine dehydrogenase Mo-binding subunit
MRAAAGPAFDRNGDTLVGRGIGYAQRSGAVVAIAAEVEIDCRRGKVWARKFTVAHDSGLIINPDGLRLYRRQCRAGMVDFIGDLGEKLWQPTGIGTQFCSSRPKKVDTSSRVHPCRGW